MLSDIDIKCEIMEARRGSDIHGLVDKIADQLHTRNPANSPESDWFFAQTVLYKWTEGTYRVGLREGANFGNRITELLNHYAFLAYNNDRMDKKNSFDYWMQAQRKLAEQVIGQTR